MADGNNRSVIIQKEPFQNYLIFTFGVIVLVICIFGLVGNLLSLSIFVRKKFRTYSINVYLAVLSITDFSLLTLALPLYAVGPLLTFCKDPQILLLHATLSIRLYPIAYIFHCCSIWLLVAVTIDRWLAVCKPFSVAVNHQVLVHRALKVTAGIIATAILFNLCRFWEISIEFDVNTNTTQPVMKLRKNPLYLLLYVAIGNVTFIYAIPFIVMIFFTVRIWLGISKSRRRRRKISTSEMDDNQINRMLRFVVLCYLCCYMPPFVLNILEPINPEFFDQTIGYIFSVVNNLLVLLNASTTFLFYLNFCGRYRQEAKRILATITGASPEELRLLNERNRFGHIYHNLNRSPSISVSRRSTRDSKQASFSSNKHSIEQQRQLIRQYSIDQSSNSSRKSSTTKSSTRSFRSVNSTTTSSSSDRISTTNLGRITQQTKRRQNRKHTLRRQVSIRLMDVAWESLKRHSTKRRRNKHTVQKRAETIEESTSNEVRKISVRFKPVHSDIESSNCDV